MSNSVKVQLVQLYKPDEIFVKFLEGKLSKNNENIRKKVYSLQKELENLSKSAPKIKDPKIGEVYGCYFEGWKKWIRGRVISRQDKTKYKIFCLDHGHYKTNIDNFIVIGDTLKELNSSAFYKISLGLQPVDTNKWCKQSIEMCMEINSKREELNVSFIPTFGEKDLFVGDLFIEDRENRYSLSEKFLSKGLAKRQHSDFCTIFDKMHSKNQSLVSDIKPKKRLEMYENSSTANNLITLKDLIVCGYNLKPFFNDINDTIIKTVHKSKFSVQNEDLNDIQKVIWPQICDLKHSVIISSKNDDLTSLYLLPMINIISGNNHQKNKNFSGTTAIIFAPNSAKIKKILAQCEKYAPHLRIVAASGMNKEAKYDVLNGCDFLITTPPAYLRIFENLALDVINEDKLKCIIFHDFSQDSLTQFDQEISIIMRTRYKKKIPQTLVVSKTVSKNLKFKILKVLDATETVFLFDNYLDAAAFVGLSISIEVSHTDKGKLENLKKNDMESYEKCIIVVNDSNLEADLSMKGVNALFCDNSKIAKLWDESNSNKCVLITDDTILNDSSVQNANYLIHFDLPDNKINQESINDKFSKRFKTFKKAIQRKLASFDEKEVLKTKIILNDEDVKQFEGLISYLIAREILSVNDDVVKKLREKNELVKCIQQAPLCSNLIHIGKCKKFNCVDRHHLLEHDKPLSNMDVLKKFITFELISLQSPTTFFVKIREYYDNKWISYDQSFEYIQQKLEIDMQNYCSEKKTLLALNEGKVGHIYAKYDNNLAKWVRGKMIKRVSNEIVLLQLMDHAIETPDIPAVEKKLIKLPEEFTKLNPLIYKLQIMNLVPFDGENSYSSNDINKLKDYMKIIPKDAVYTSKIEAKIDNILFAFNMDARNSKKSIVFGLKNAHKKLNISQVDEDFGKKILKLVSGLSNEDEEGREENIESKTDNEEKIPQKANQVVYWKQLNCDRNYSIILKHFNSPYSFFVVLENSENLTLKNALRNIEECKNVEPLIDFNINDYCLIALNDRKFLRAKILDLIENDTVKVLLVDYGEIQTCDKNNLFQIPDKFLSLQFQAIHCSMAGICPKYNLSIWPKLQKSAVFNLINEFSRKSLKMQVIPKDREKHNEYGVTSHNVLLYDDESKYFLHKLAAKRGIASECKEYNVDCYESDTNEEDDIDCDDSVSNFNLDEDYESLTDTSTPTDEDFIKNDGDFLACDKFLHQISSNESTTVSTVDSGITFSSNEFRPGLKSLFKSPYTEWRQNEFLIYLIISAQDSQEYGIKIDEKSLDVIIKYGEDKIERTIIQLYSSVRVKLCSHELAGNNIIVRLAKKFVGMEWKRLTFSKEKSQFIKFSTESVPNIDNYEDEEDEKELCESWGPDYSDIESDNILENDISSEDEF